MKEKKFDFTKRANANYQKAIYIEDYHRSREINKSLKLRQNAKEGEEVESTYKIDSLSLALTLNYSVFLWGIKREEKKALRTIKRKLQESLEDFEVWEKEDMEDIKK